MSMEVRGQSTKNVPVVPQQSIATTLLPTQQKKAPIKIKNKAPYRVMSNKRNKNLSKRTQQQQNRALRSLVFIKKKLWSYDPIGYYFTLKAKDSDTSYKMVTWKVLFHGKSLENMNRNDIYFHLYAQGFEDIVISSQQYWRLIDERNKLTDEDDVIITDIVSNIKNI
jgi:hypothetical protein